MEDMSTILMHMDALYILAIDIAAKMWSLVDNKALLSILMSQMGKGCAKQPGTYYQIVIMFHPFYDLTYLYR